MFLVRKSNDEDLKLEIKVNDVKVDESSQSDNIEILSTKRKRIKKDPMWHTKSVNDPSIDLTNYKKSYKEKY